MPDDHLLREYAPRLHAALAIGANAQHLGNETYRFSSNNEAWEESDTSASDSKHVGVMVALYPSQQLAAELAVDGGEAVEELHVTLAFLGNVGAEITADEHDRLLAVVTEWASNEPTITAKTNGIGVFDNDPPCTYASIDSPQLPGVHQRLREALQGAGLAPLQTHGFTPHLTLAYADRRDVHVPRLPMQFEHVAVVFAGQRTDIPLAQPSAGESPGVGTVSVAAGDEKAGQSSQAGDGVQMARAFTTEINGRQLITGPAQVVKSSLREPTLEEIAAERLLTMRGRFVGADKPNRNGALWSAADLELSAGSVVKGPLNWLHEGKHIIGCITDAEYKPTRASQNADAGPSEAHIVATSSIWKWIWPDEAFVVNQASELGQLWYSMECISTDVSCAGENGCGNTTTYAAYISGAGCEHVRTRAAVRHFQNPIFLGGAVIVPPTRPGWAEADASVLSEAASFAEKAFEDAGRPDVSANTWEQMLAQLVRYTTPS